MPAKVMHDHGDGREDRDPAEAGDVDEAELQPQQHDAQAQQPACGDPQPGREGAGERGLQAGHLADDDAERDRRREDRHGGQREVREPRDEGRGCRDGESRHPFAHRATPAESDPRQVAQLGAQKCSCRNSGVTGTPVQIG